MTKPAIERLRERLPAYDYSCGPRLLRGLVAEGEREALAAAIYNLNPMMDQAVNLDGRPTSKPFALTWEQYAESWTHDESEPCREIADLVIARYAALALGEVTPG